MLPDDESAYPAAYAEAVQSAGTSYSQPPSAIGSTQPLLPYFVPRAEYDLADDLADAVTLDVTWMMMDGAEYAPPSEYALDNFEVEFLIDTSTVHPNWDDFTSHVHANEGYVADYTFELDPDRGSIRIKWHGVISTDPDEMPNRGKKDERIASRRERMIFIKFLSIRLPYDSHGSAPSPYDPTVVHVKTSPLRTIWPYAKSETMRCPFRYKLYTGRNTPFSEYMLLVTPPQHSSEIGMITIIDRREFDLIYVDGTCAVSASDPSVMIRDALSSAIRAEYLDKCTAEFYVHFNKESIRVYVRGNSYCRSIYTWQHVEHIVRKTVKEYCRLTRPSLTCGPGTKLNDDNTCVPNRAWGGIGVSARRTTPADGNGDPSAGFACEKQTYDGMVFLVVFGALLCAIPVAYAFRLISSGLRKEAPRPNAVPAERPFELPAAQRLPAPPETVARL